MVGEQEGNAGQYRLQVLPFEEEPVVQGQAEAGGQLQGGLHLSTAPHPIQMRADQEMHTETALQ